MHIDDWLKERERRRDEYERLTVRGSALLSIYDQTADPAVFRDIRQNVRAMDKAYLAWCETDHWGVEYDHTTE